MNARARRLNNRLELQIVSDPEPVAPTSFQLVRFPTRPAKPQVHA